MLSGTSFQLSYPLGFKSRLLPPSSSSSSSEESTIFAYCEFRLLPVGGGPASCLDSHPSPVVSFCPLFISVSLSRFNRSRSRLNSSLISHRHPSPIELQIGRPHNKRLGPKIASR